MMRGIQLGTRSTAVLVTVVFASTVFFFTVVGRFTALYSQQTEGVVGSCARHSVTCCCLKNKIRHLKVRKRRRNSNVNVNPSVIVPITQNNDAHIYAAVKLQQNMRNAIQKKLNDKKAASDKTATSSLTNTVDAIQRNSTNNRNSYVKKIKKRHTARRSNLQLKVEARNLARQKAKHTNALQKSFIFSNVNTESIAKITDQMEYEMYQDGIVVCQKGDEANNLYLIISGTCDVTIGGKKISSMNELEIFGESALFPGANGVAVRGATVTCVGNVQLLSLSKEKFDYLVESGSLNENCLIKLRQVLKEHKEADLKKRKEREEEGQSEMKVTIPIVKIDVAEDSPVHDTATNDTATAVTKEEKVDPPSHIAQIRTLVAGAMKNSTRLRKTCTRLNKGDASVNTISREQFEMLVAHIIKKDKKKKKDNIEIEIHFFKKETWIFIVGKDQKEEIISVEQLAKWLFGQTK